MSGQVRDLWLRVSIDGTLVGASTPVRIQQQLEGAVTTVAEISLAGITPALATNAAVAVHHVNRNRAPDPNYDSRQLFDGIVNRIGGVGFPHGVSLSCTGALAKLRRTRPSDHTLTGLTDIQAVQYVLTYCGVAYDTILGWNYVLGRVQPHGGEHGVIWRAGQSGAEIIGELDRVFACATIELGDGRVVRFPYSRAPYLYTSPTYAKTFTKGQAGATFYSNERDRGDIDQIANYWVVRGLSFSGADGDVDAGCQFQYSAVANTDHALLGPGVDVGPQEFSSDLIDSEELAKAIAERLMQWNNREPDTIRIQCGNDARVGVGALILVKDPSYGIDLSSQKRYLITAVSREGDTMLLDGVGGATGAHGAVVSHLYRTCNDTTTDTGTNPPAFGAPDPVLPDFPGLGDVPSDLPPIEVPTEPNTEDSIIGCTEVTGGLHDPDYVAGGPWREVGVWAWGLEDAERGGFQNDHAALLGTQGILIYNTTAVGTTKTAANDHRFGKNDLITIAGSVTLNYPNTILQLRLIGEGGTGVPVEMDVQFYTEPGLHTATTTPPGSSSTSPAHDWGLWAFSENTDGGLPGIPTGDSSQDTGGIRGEPIAAGTRLSFSVAFNPATEYQAIQVGGDLTTFMYDPTHQTIGDLDLHYPDCTHTGHLLWLRAVNPDGLATPPGGDWYAKPLVVIDELSLGLDTCVLNPDYPPPIVEGF